MSAFLSAVAISTYERYRSSGSKHDIDIAVESAQAAVGMILGNHPNWTGILNNLGIMLESQYKCTGTMTDLEE
jgi:hypothetical protein